MIILFKNVLGWPKIKDEFFTRNNYIGHFVRSPFAIFVLATLRFYFQKSSHLFRRETVPRTIGMIMLLSAMKLTISKSILTQFWGFFAVYIRSFFIIYSFLLESRTKMFLFDFPFWGDRSFSFFKTVTNNQIMQRICSLECKLTVHVNCAS